MGQKLSPFYKPFLSVGLKWVVQKLSEYSKITRDESPTKNSTFLTHYTFGKIQSDNLCLNQNVLNDLY